MKGLKAILFTAFLGAGMTGSAPLFAQGYLSDMTGVNAVLSRDPARQASTEIDAVLTNPAGTAFLEDGFHFSLNGMFAFRDVDVKDRETPFSSWQTDEKRFLPAVQLAYKRNRWAVSASFASEGGFGKREGDGSAFVDGWMNSNGLMDEINESFQNLNASMLLNGFLHGASGLDIQADDQVGFSAKSLNTSLYNWTIRLGGSFEITRNFSAYVGLKANYVYSNADMSIASYVYRPSTGEHWSYSDYAQSWRQVLDQMDGIDEASREQMEESIDDLSALGETGFSSDDKIDGWGFAPIIGLDYKCKNFNFGAKYEFASHIKTKGAGHFNVPAVFSAGMSWQALPSLKVAAGSNVVFESYNSIGSENNTSNAYDLSASCTYDFTEKWLVSGGYTYGHMERSVPDYNVNPILPVHDHRFSLGIAYRPLEKMEINFGGCFDLKSIINCNLLYDVSSDLGATSFQQKLRLEYKPRVQIAVGVNYSI